MIICVEGCLGIGKSTLVKQCAEQLPYIPFYEDVMTNPFLLDFYQQQKDYAMHVQYTFLMLQDRKFRAALKQAGVQQNVRPGCSLKKWEPRPFVTFLPSKV